MIDKIKQAIEEWMKQYHDITGWESDIAKAVLAAIQSDLPKPLPSRERMIEIINNSKDQTPGGLADAILHDGQIKIGNGKWINKASQQYWIVWSSGKIEHGTGLRIEDFLNHTDKGKQAFLTLREAEEQLQKDGFVKVADGWVDPKTKVWFVGKCGITVIDNLRIEEAKSFTKDCYQSIDNAIEAFRKLAKETK